MTYSTPAARIGKHLWRYTTGIFWLDKTTPVCNPEWTTPDRPNEWRSYREWPTYDFDNGATAGLPRSLAPLYRKHEGDLKAAMYGTPAPQASLF